MKDNVDPVKKSWIGKIGAFFSRFSGWIAKGYDGKSPCTGG